MSSLEDILVEIQVSDTVGVSAAITDADGKPFSSDNRYILHFNANEVPPLRGFWSLTMYNDRQFFAVNPIDRYAIGDRDKLAFNPDGSLDLFIQREVAGQRQRGKLAASTGQRCLHNKSAPLLAKA